MTTPTIPRGLKPITNGYAAGAPPGVQRTEVEGGSARYGLAYDRGMQTFNVTLAAMSPVVFAVWDTFLHHAIKKGALSFTMPLDSGFGQQDHAVNMLPGSYQATRVGALTTVTFQVETENKAYDWTEAEAESLLALFDEYGEGYADLLARLAQFANVDSNVLDF